MLFTGLTALRRHGRRDFNLEFTLPTYTPPKLNFANPELYHEITTYATSGNMVTKYFGDTFNPEKVERYLKYDIIFNNFYYSQNYKMNKNITLHVNIEKLTMKKKAKIYNGQKPVKDWIRIVNESSRYNKDYISLESKHFSEKYNPPGNYEKMFYTYRSISMDDIKKQSLSLMPGFKLSWYYSGMQVEPYPYYAGYFDTKPFIR